MSCIFRHAISCLAFSYPSFSSPAFSRSAMWSVILMFCNVTSYNTVCHFHVLHFHILQSFSRPAFSANHYGQTLRAKDVRRRAVKNDVKVKQWIVGLFKCDTSANPDNNVVKFVGRFWASGRLYLRLYPYRSSSLDPANCADPSIYSCHYSWPLRFAKIGCILCKLRTGGVRLAAGRNIDEADVIHTKVRWCWGIEELTLIELV